jgi:phospho-N-acetylmuramoyl-pentapeptide-transferase
MISIFLAVASSFFVSVTLTPFLIRWLRTNSYGQRIRDDGPIEHPHVGKVGTPTMGGFAIMAGVVAGYLVPHIRTDHVAFSNSGLVIVALILACGLVGWIDDWLGIKHKRNLGLRKRGKLAGQLVIGSVFAVTCVHALPLSTHVSFTRDLGVDLGPWLWSALAVVLILASTNALNLTDGLDGLAAGSSAFTFSVYAIIAFWQFRHFEVYEVPTPHALDLAMVAAAMVGACAGFLWWNAAPARIFMGDTGSMALGGGIAGLALLTRTQLLLPILGALYVMETMSVVLQVISFRGFGRRIFRMSPIHHHFEVKGWPETTVTVRFWLLSAAFTATALGFFYGDFIRLGVGE